MSRQLIIIALIAFTSVNAHAQLLIKPKKPSVVTSANVAPGKLLSQFAAALKPDAFSGDFAKQKKSFLANAESATDAASVTKQISLLTGYIKPEKFKNASGPAAILKATSSASSMNQVAAILKTLDAGVKPQAFSNIWQLQRTNWLNEVNVIDKTAK